MRARDSPPPESLPLGPILKLFDLHSRGLRGADSATYASPPKSSIVGLGAGYVTPLRSLDTAERSPGKEVLDLGLGHEP